MAEQQVGMLTMRRPEVAGDRREDEFHSVTWFEGGRVDLQQIRESLLDGRAVDVDSFPDAIRAAAVFFHGEGDSGVIEVFQAGTDGRVYRLAVRAIETEMTGLRSKGRVRHPLFASLLGTLRILWFAVRHPGKSAWIDHDTGEVWTADRTM